VKIAILFFAFGTNWLITFQLEEIFMGQLENSKSLGDQFLEDTSIQFPKGIDITAKQTLKNGKLRLEIRDENGNIIDVCTKKIEPSKFSNPILRFFDEKITAILWKRVYIPSDDKKTILAVLVNRSSLAKQKPLQDTQKSTLYVFMKSNKFITHAATSGFTAEEAFKISQQILQNRSISIQIKGQTVQVNYHPKKGGERITIRLEDISSGEFKKIHKEVNVKSGKVYAAQTPKTTDTHQLTKVASDKVVKESLMSLAQEHKRIQKYKGKPQIIQSFKIGKDYYGTEYMNRGDFHHYFTGLKEQERQPLKRNIFKQMAQAVAVVHSKKRVHQDLKPCNFLVHENVQGEAIIKLADFGTERSKGNQEANQGSNPYMAPEKLTILFRNGHLSSQLYHDVFSLGVIFYEIKYGKRPEISAYLEKLGEFCKKCEDEDTYNQTIAFESFMYSIEKKLDKRNDLGLRERYLKHLSEQQTTIGSFIKFLKQEKLIKQDEQLLFSPNFDNLKEYFFIRKHLETELATISQLMSESQDPEDRLIYSLLQKDPSKRSSIKQVLQQLETLE
jgi:serine/threonine protein kinase